MLQHFGSIMFPVNFNLTFQRTLEYNVLLSFHLCISQSEFKKQITGGQIESAIKPILFTSAGLELSSLFK